MLLFRLLIWLYGRVGRCQSGNGAIRFSEGWTAQIAERTSTNVSGDERKRVKVQVAFTDNHGFRS